MPLTDVQARTAKPRAKSYKLADSGWLYLVIRPNGAKLWRMDYRFAGKTKTLSFGPYPLLSLKDARSKRDDAKRLLADGVDPSEARKEAKAVYEATHVNTLATIGEEYIAKREADRVSPETARKLRWLLSLVAPLLGARPVTEITPAEALEALRTIEVRGKLETANRCRAFLGRVFRYAIATSRATSDPTAPLKGALASARTRHRAAITDPKALGEFLRAVDGYAGQPETLYALKLLPYLFCRPAELRKAAWAEFDLDGAVWAVPAARMKMRVEHRVPLAPQVVALLRELRPMVRKGPLCFPSTRSAERPISENTLNAAMRRMGYSKDEVTAHGFRATASTLLNESNQFSPDAIERALAHQDANAVRRAYARGAYWEERVRMMTWWADYLDKLRSQRT